MFVSISQTGGSVTFSSQYNTSQPIVIRGGVTVFEQLVVSSSSITISGAAVTFRFRSIVSQIIFLGGGLNVTGTSLDVDNYFSWDSGTIGWTNSGKHERLSCNEIVINGNINLLSTCTSQFLGPVKNLHSTIITNFGTIVYGTSRLTLRYGRLINTAGE